MAVQTVTERLTYEDWLRLPATNQPHEILDGVIRMTPAPASDHQWIAGNLHDALRHLAHSGRLGVVLSAPVDVVIRKDPLRTRQPDVLFLSSERTGIRGRRELREQPVIEAAPDLTVEVLSPGETRPDVLAKLEDYRAIGVRECWLVSPEAETVEVLRLGPAGWERDGLHGRGDKVRSVVLPELHLPVDHVFAEE